MKTTILAMWFPLPFLEFPVPNVTLLPKLMRLPVRPLFPVVVQELAVLDVSPLLKSPKLPLHLLVMQVIMPPVDLAAKANSADIYVFVFILALLCLSTLSKLSTVLTKMFRVGFIKIK